MGHIAGTGYEVMMASFLSAFLAQAIKVVAHAIRYRAFNFRLLVETGGMPSSHSSAMTGMASSVGLVSGFDSVVFAVSLGIALIVMYDAAGVRQAAGKMARILNAMAENIYKDPAHLPERLRELLGHTPIEVIAGATLGFVIAYAIHVRLMG